MNHNNHPEDQASIESMHQKYVSNLDDLRDELMNFQDDAYALGRSRGVKEGHDMAVGIAQMVNGAISACGSFIKAAGMQVKPCAKS